MKNLALALIVVAACGRGAAPTPPGPRGYVDLSAHASAHLASSSGGAPLVCATFTLQPISIDPTGHETTAGPPVVLSSSASSQTDAILGCIDDGATGPNWGYLVTATDFVICGTTTPAGVSSPVAFTQVTLSCKAGLDVPATVNVDVSIPVANAAGYVDISASVNGVEVTIGCKSADVSGGFLHFGETGQYPAGNAPPLAFTGIGESQAFAPSDVQQFDGIVRDGAQDSAYYTGLLTAPPAGQSAEVLQAFAQACPPGSYYSASQAPECDSVFANGAVTTAAKLADLFEVVPGTLWLSASVTGPSELTITSGTGALTSNAAARTTAWNPATTRQQAIHFAAPIAGVFADRLAPGALVVALGGPGAMTFETVSFSGGAWSEGPAAPLSSLTAAQMIALGLFQQAPPGCFTACDAAAQPFGGGSGSPADPFLVCSRAHLANVSTAPAASFKQAADLDLAGAPFAPLADDSTGFTGTYDGQDHVIANLTWIAPAQYSVGLFQFIGATGVVQNLTLRGANLEGRNRVGGIAGRLDGQVLHAAVQGSTIKSSASVGGIAGEMADDSDGTNKLIDHATVTGTTVFSFANDGANCDCAAAGIVGVIKNGGGQVTASSTSGVDVTWDPAGSYQVEQFSYAGGIVGYFASQGSGLIGDCHVNGGTVHGVNDAGGITGRNEGDGAVSDCSTSAAVTGKGGHYTGVGGVTGWAAGLYLRNSSTGPVTGVDNVGGLAGSHYAGSIQDSWSSSAVTSTGDGAHVGGLTGLQGNEFNDGGSITDCYFTGSVLSTGDNALLGGGVGLFTMGSQANLYSAASSVTEAGAGAAHGFLGAFAPDPGNPSSWSGAYYLDNASFPADVEGAPLSAAQLVTQASFAGFDFSTHWKMPSANPGHALSPVLAWQCGTGGIVCVP